MNFEKNETGLSAGKEWQYANHSEQERMETILWPYLKAELSFIVTNLPLIGIWKIKESSSFKR